MATLTFNGRLPGVICQAALPPPGEEPLRLDVAAFVGFAERGPLHTPVALEDFGQYQALFGGDLQVARDEGRPVYAHLPRAVQAFFDNGGRRCYVVRVAGATARANRFPIPGLVAWTEGSGFSAVVAPAAWVGRWSDDLRVGTQLRATPLPFQGNLGLSGEPGTGSISLVLEVPTGLGVATGDVLRVRARAGGLVLLFPIAATTRLGPATTATRGIPTRVEAPLAAVHAFAGEPPEPAPLPQSIQRLVAGGWEALPLDPDLLFLEHDDVSRQWELAVPAAAVQPGDLLRIATSAGSVALFPVEALTLGYGQMSPPGPGLWTASSAHVLWFSALDGGSPPAGDLEMIQVELLRFDLAIRVGDDTVEAWPELRFNPGPGYWADALAVPPDDGPASPPDLAANRSLRLAAPAAAASAPPPIFLPLAMPEVLDQDRFAAALPDAGPGGKDGLDAFDPVALFLDQRLARTGVRDLVNQADHLVQRLGDSRLVGLHSLLPVEEVALVAIPDLAHRPWPAFVAPPALPPLPPLPQPEPVDWSQFQDCPEPPPDAYAELSPAQVVALFYGAFQYQDDAAAAIFLTAELQDQLATTTLAALLQVERRPDSFHVDAPACAPGPGIPVTVRGTLHFVDEASVSHAFTMAYLGGWRIAAVEPLTAWQQAPGSLRALAALPALRLAADLDVDSLLAVHEALVTLCAARADALAVISLPEHFQKRDVIAWVQRLSTSGNLAEGNALSYAALYHPWLRVPEPTTPELAPLRLVPPDGAICGVIAARELAAGPWAAPANMALRGVVGVGQAIGEADYIDLFDAQANILRRQPGQFSQLSAHTLSLDPLLVQVSVRRLLIYLRKLALRRGMAYVFETNNERFRRRVEAAFERTLNQLTARGALTAFQVVTGEGLNTPNDVDNGRFLIGLKVAPAIPVEFITIVLLRSGEELLQVLEV